MFIMILRHTCDNSKIARLQNNFFLQIAKSKQNYDGRHNYFVNLRHFELQFLSSRLATLSVTNFKQAEMSVMTFTRFRKLAEDARSHFFKKNVFNRNFFI